MFDEEKSVWGGGRGKGENWETLTLTLTLTLSPGHIYHGTNPTVQTVQTV